MLMSQAQALSPEDVGGLREQLAAGTTPTVWFTSAAVGVPEGRSGKVIALEDPAEGDFIQIRPAGSRDVLSFSVAEVTVVKPPRRRREKGQETAKPPTADAGTSASRNSRAAPGGDVSPAATQQAAAASAVKGPPEERTRSQAESPAQENARRKPRQPASGATLTLTAGPEGQWSVEITSGKKRLLRSTPVSASAVAQAAKVLHSDVAEAVEPLIEAAREQQRSRVDQLRRELADAQRLLDELT
jgi:hypothetical protein